jgi:ferric-dicitrate binding protein FerR (iron transport regulator)
MAVSFPRYARILAGLLRRAGVSEPPEAAPLDRADAVAMVASAIDRRERRRRQARWALATVSAAALFSAGIGLTHLRERGVSHQPNESVSIAPAITVVAYVGQVAASAEAARPAEPTGPGRPLGIGSSYKTEPSASATLALSTGTWMSVDPASEVVVVDVGRMQIFDLREGSLKADVAKLGPNDRFLVRTRDAEVEVRGTSFRVSVLAPSAEMNGTRTCVQVYEGVVVVRKGGSEVAVVKGATWPNACADAAVPLVPTATKAVALGAGAPHSTTPGSIATASSNLAAQNDLFAEGMRNKRNGENAAALLAFDHLLSKYPSGQLAENAAVERMKLLASIDRSKAMDAARRYLANYPGGYARAAAESILHEAP